jgi:hypothetical protein
MYEFNLKDTAAYKVVDQMISHMWGGEKWEERDLMGVYKLFCRRHGSWQGIMEGDPSQFQLLEQTIGDYINYRDLLKAANNIAASL